MWVHLRILCAVGLSWRQRKAYEACCAILSTNEICQWHCCPHADLHQGKSKPSFPIPPEIQHNADHLLCCVLWLTVCWNLVKADDKLLMDLESRLCVVSGESGLTKLPGLVHLKAEFEGTCWQCRTLWSDQLSEDIVAILLCCCTGDGEIGRHWKKKHSSTPVRTGQASPQRCFSQRLHLSVLWERAEHFPS